MTPEKILELAHETVRLTWINDSPEDLIAFAQSVIEAERERTKELVEVLKEAVDCGLVPKTSASEGGASKYARQVIAADSIRAAIAKYEETNEPT